MQKSSAIRDRELLSVLSPTRSGRKEACGCNITHNSLTEQCVKKFYRMPEVGNIKNVTNINHWFPR